MRLGEAVGAEQLAAEHVRQPLLLLLLGALRVTSPKHDSACTETPTPTLAQAVAISSTTWR